MIGRKLFYFFMFFLCLTLSEHGADAGFFTYAACQTGCNVVAAACYTAAGLTIGTVTLGAGAPAAALACSAAQGLCMAGCAALIVTPTP